MKLTQKAPSGEQKLNIVSYNPGLKTEFHISCSNLPKPILYFAKLCILPDFLPQPSNFFTRIYPPYIVGKNWDPGILDPGRFSAQIRKVEARLGKLVKIRKV